MVIFMYTHFLNYKAFLLILNFKYSFIKSGFISAKLLYIFVAMCVTVFGELKLYYNV